MADGSLALLRSPAEMHARAAKIETDRSLSRAAVWVLLLLFAPCLLAFNQPPSPTLLNQCLAVGLCGAVVAALAGSATVGGARGIWPLTSACTALAFGVACSVVLGALPAPIGGAVILSLVCAAVAAWSGSAIAAGRDGEPVMTWLLAGLLCVGVISALISCVQVFAPDWPDGDWIARSGMPGRAVGNLRQPNHLSSLLLWSTIAAVGLFEARRLYRGLTWTLVALLVFALVLSGSRTGMLGTLVLAAWGLLDRQLTRGARALLAATPLLYALAWIGMSVWGHANAQVFGAEGRLSFSSGGDISSSRFAIWSNALTMLAHEPLTGVGFGEFNVAWTLSELPDRPTAFFDHTHNLPLQLLVELGMPLGGLVNVLLLAALWRAWRRAWEASGDEGIVRRVSFMLVLMIGLHSQLEYPLWYAYFLLPTAFAWGFALAPLEVRNAQSDVPGDTRRTRALAGLGIAMILGAAAAVLDYRQIVAIYAPPSDAAPLEERIVRGQHSPLFAHHADYAAATALGTPVAPLPASQKLAFTRAPHYLLDIRLMVAWAQALSAQGETDKARWLAARIREFRNPGSDDFFAPCSQSAEAAQAFQCQAPRRTYHWREFT